jgi:hypothetical protein
MDANRSLLQRLCYAILAAIWLLTCCMPAAAQPPGNRDKLLDTYRRNLARLDENSFGLPLLVQSSEQGEHSTVDVYGIFEYPFEEVVDTLRIPANWCDILCLHPNIKASTWQKRQNGWALTLYLGRKKYQAPEDTHPVLYNFRIASQQPDYLHIALTAASGPFGTRDHTLRFEALPLDKHRSFVHVRYAYSSSGAFRLAEQAYFATLGRNKIGFTTTGTDTNGRPVYIKGPRAALERNAVRYFFAFQAFMDTLSVPRESRFAKRIHRWYALTDAYRRQLYEMDREDYAATKTQAYKNQQWLQRNIETATPRSSRITNRILRYRAKSNVMLYTCLRRNFVI